MSWTCKITRNRDVLKLILIIAVSDIPFVIRRERAHVECHRNDHSAVSNRSMLRESGCIRESKQASRIQGIDS